VHPLHPHHLGQRPLAYNWTVYQSEWATDVAFAARSDLERFYQRWLRHALLNFDSATVLRFLGRSGRVSQNGDVAVQTDLQRRFEGTRLKHWVEQNSLKLYDHLNVLRSETTINKPEGFRVFRASQDNPEGPKAWRGLRHGVADLHRRAEVSQAANERQLEALAGVAETRTVKELTEPLCRPVSEPGARPRRSVRALNPLGASDAALLAAISAPQYAVNGIRNRDLVQALHPRPTREAAQQQQRRRGRVTRLIRILRGHGLLHKVPRTHRYQVPVEARTRILAILAARDANPDKLMSTAA
jgi:hypothetical protein